MNCCQKSNQINQRNGLSGAFAGSGRFTRLGKRVGVRAMLVLVGSALWVLVNFGILCDVY